MLETRRGPDGVPCERHEIDGGSFRIGRGGESDWVLADPGRVLSKCHCLLVADDEGWTVSDTSSNGTVLNGRPLDPGGRARLQDGDRLILGSYEIEVHAIAASGGSLRQDAPVRESTEDPFPYPGADEFGFLLPDADPRSPFEPVGLYAGSAGVSETGADHVSDLHEHIRLPRPTSELLPADWDAPGMDVVDGEVPGRGAQDGGEVPKRDVLEPERPAPVAAILPANTLPLTPRPVQPPPTMPRGSADAPAAAAGFAALAEGAGMAGAMVPDPEGTLRALGGAFHAMVHELRRAMMARAAIKGEFRIEQTIIQPAGNNPLKFAIDDADALSALLGTGRRSGMTPRDAVSGALRDMRLHELAVMTAMGQAVRDMLEEFSPARLETEVDAGPFDAVAGRREVRLWRAFRARHERASQTLQDDFDSAFGRSFVRAYEMVLRQAEGAKGADHPEAGGQP